MIRFSFLSALFLLPSLISAQNEEFEEAMKRAAAQKQIVMIDFYTDWCGWCKELEKKTFPEPVFRAAMKDRFIMVRLNAEKEDGYRLAMRYGVRSFPQCVFLTPELRVVQIIPGYMEAPAYAAELDSIWKRHQAGNYLAFSTASDPGFPDFYRNLFQPDRKKIRWPSQGAKDSFLANPANWETEVGAIVINTIYPTSLKYLRPLALKHDAWKRGCGERTGSAAFQFMMSNYIDSNHQWAADKMRDSLRYYADLASAGKPGVAKDLCEIFLEMYYSSSGQWKEYALLMNQRITAQGAQYANEVINEAAWAIFENTRDTAALNLALGWMKKVVDIDDEYNHADTYASLLFALGRLDEAEEEARKAIELAQKSGANADATRKLIGQINSAR